MKTENEIVSEIKRVGGPITDQVQRGYVLALQWVLDGYWDKNVMPNDDRALLEEAVKLLSDAVDRFKKYEMSSDSEAPYHHRWAMITYEDFLTRAKERGII